MGRFKRDLSYLRPFCYYCERSFKNELFLHQHQKAKHFTCEHCNNKFPNIQSMKSHYKNNHDQHIDKVPNAKAGKDSVSLKVFGMQGVPKAEIDKWILQGSQRYWTKFMHKKELKQKEAERAKVKSKDKDKEDKK